MTIKNELSATEVGYKKCKLETGRFYLKQVKGILIHHVKVKCSYNISRFTSSRMNILPCNIHVEFNPILMPLVGDGRTTKKLHIYTAAQENEHNNYVKNPSH